MSVHEFVCVTTLNPNCSLAGTLGIDFNDSTNAANLEILSSKGLNNISIKPSIGELLRPVTMNEQTFTNEQSKLRGMNEHITTVSNAFIKDATSKIFQTANVAACLCAKEDTLR